MAKLEQFAQNQAKIEQKKSHVAKQLQTTQFVWIGRLFIDNNYTMLEPYRAEFIEIRKKVKCMGGAREYKGTEG